MAMLNMLTEAVVLAFVMGGMLGAGIALHLSRIKPAGRRVATDDREHPTLQPVRVRRRPRR